MTDDIDFVAASKRAIQNVIRHGDTDIFPFPIENHAFYDMQTEAFDLIKEYDDKFLDYIVKYPPANVSSLTPVTYSGFRWATQLDPFWNLYLLSSVLSIAHKIEAVRVPKEKSVVFSYRYFPDDDAGDIFDRDSGWIQFMQHSNDLCEEYAFVVICDISEFYPRLGHHRLENALIQVAPDSIYPSRIMKFLGNFSNTSSFGLPIGGPAARILAEATINQIDQLLLINNIKFVRFADDYHIFCASKEDAYRDLIFLSEKLHTNQGLALQKSKTRIVTSSEFKSTNPVKFKAEEIFYDNEGRTLHKLSQGRGILHFSLRFDPYSITADSDYAKLKDEVKKFDVIGILREELAKSRIHVALSRKVINAIRFLDAPEKDAAILSMLDNFDVLYPILSSVFMTIYAVVKEIDVSTQEKVVFEIQKLIKEDSYLLRVDIHLGYAIRILANAPNNETLLLMQKIYSQRTSPLIRQEIILIMARLNEWYWLSDVKNRFRTLSDPEKRAMVIASYVLKDEGDHWRNYIKRELSPAENFISIWAKSKTKVKEWRIPL